MSTEIHDEKKIGFIAIEIAMFHSWLKENHDVNLSWDDIKDVKELILKREDFQISKTMSLFMDTAIMQYLGEESEDKIKKLIEIVTLLAQIVLLISLFYFIFFTKTSTIDVLTSPLILVSLLIALCFPLILMWAKRVNKKKL